MDTSKSTIKKIVKESLHKVGHENGSVKVDNSLLLYNSGVSILIYDENSKLVKGHYPMDFLPKMPIKLDHTQIINSQTDRWLVYDLKGASGVIVRGISPINLASETLNITIENILLILPFYILLAGIGGYLITKKSFNPIQTIIKTANSISSGDDLSKRINLEKGSSEVAHLSETFDNMFNRLEDSFEKEKQFTSDASHELRTPVSVIISESEYALGLEGNSKEANHSLNVILEQGKMMSSFISQLLMFARTDSSSSITSFEELNLSELVEIIIEELLTYAKEKNITLLGDIEDDIIMKADQTLITRMIINLISNSITYSKEVGYVKISVYHKESNVIISVCDNGIGIDKDNLDKIWNKFYRVEKSRRKANVPNLGLGLPMVKWIVEIHGGTIEAESKLNEGSTFTITLPIKPQKLGNRWIFICFLNFNYLKLFKGVNSYISSAIAATSGEWVTIIIHLLSLTAKSLNIFITSFWVSKSKLPVGSSARIISGS